MVLVLMDLMERPAWVEQKIEEIHQVYMDVHARIFELIHEPDGSFAFACFGLWAPGPMAKVQCDASAMFSPAMFRQFVLPTLTAQCDWLDYSMYHLDGTQAMCHLDALLGIESLNAIEWTPQAGIENGGNPRWYPLYKQILDAGKSVQIIGVQPDELFPILDHLGSKGLFIMCHAPDLDTAYAMIEKADRYR